MLTFLGVGSAFSTELGNNSAYFYHEDDLILIDCGELIFRELVHDINFEKVKDIHIFITHCHCDHVGSLGTLLAYLFVKYNKVAKIYHGGIRLKEYLSLVGVSDEKYVLNTSLEIRIRELKFHFVETKHSDELLCFGIEIKTPDKTIYYSGDASIIPNDILVKFREGKIDTLYQDVTMIKNNNSHLTIDELKILIPKELRVRVVAMHLNEGSEKMIEDLGFNRAKLS